MKTTIIAAMSPDRVIGREGQIPWRYPADMKRFKRLTMGDAVIMGRKTWESIPETFRPLPGRMNIVVTRTLGVADLHKDVTAVACSVTDAWGSACHRSHAYGGKVNAWFIGGAQVYAEALALPHADEIDLTLVPDRPPVEGSVLFPAIDEAAWERVEDVQHEDDPRLRREVWRRRGR